MFQKGECVIPYEQPLWLCYQKTPSHLMAPRRTRLSASGHTVIAQPIIVTKYTPRSLFKDAHPRHVRPERTLLKASAMSALLWAMSGTGHKPGDLLEETTHFTHFRSSPKTWPRKPGLFLIFAPGLPPDATLLPLPAFPSQDVLYMNLITRQRITCSMRSRKCNQ